MSPEERAARIRAADRGKVIVRFVYPPPPPGAERKTMNPKYMPKTKEQKLGYLVEECGEVLAAVGKTQRWGLDSYNPEPGASRETNREWILREIRDLELAIDMVREAIQ